MKKFFMAAGAAAVVLASCTQASDVTKIAGIVEEEGIDGVNIVVPELDIDTLVALNGGKFSYELPVDCTLLGVISAGQYKAYFVPDGTRLSVKLSESELVVKSAAKHVHSAFVEAKEKSEAIQKDFSAKVKEVRAAADITAEEVEKQIEELYEKVEKEFVDYNIDVLSRNNDNFVGLMALQNMNGMLEDSEVDSLIATLSDKLQENKYVTSLRNGVSARAKTAEGQMFTDFTVEDSDGKTVNFSDFVGNGKYVLVDFWASWCGPCKREIPNIKAVYDKYKGKDFNVLSVAVWDRPEDTVAAAKEHGVTWSQIINAQSVPTEIYGIEGIPHIMLIGPDGIILKRDLRGEMIEEEVAKYVSPKR